MSQTPAAAQAIAGRFHARFLDAHADWQQLAQRWVAESGAKLRTFEHALKGPDGEDLATEVLRIGTRDVARLLILISGTHGIEGYAGSAIQCTLLGDLISGRTQLPPDCGLLFVHALTPWGMAWYRRCDEQGIDLNRNFVDFAAPPANPDYARVRSCQQMASGDERHKALLSLRDELGQRRFEIAISGGQYEDPSAPFYGGRNKCHGREVIESLIEQDNLFSCRLHVIDLHTGLGPRGAGELICDHAPGSAGAIQSARCFDGDITLPADGTSSSVPKHGLMDYAWHAGMGDDSFFLTLEFGTSDTEALFACLDRDHRFWSRQRPRGRDDTGWPEVRGAMLDHFCPDDPLWQAQVVRRGRAVFQRLLAFS